MRKKVIVGGMMPKKRTPLFNMNLATKNAINPTKKIPSVGVGTALVAPPTPLYTKEETLLAHCLVSFCSATLEILDRMDNVEAVSKIRNGEDNATKKAFKTVEKFCETLLDASYKHKEVRSSTYVSEMTNKLIYVVEKNFQSI